MMVELQIEENEAVISLYLLISRLLNEELSPELREILIQPEVLDFLSRPEPEVRDYLMREWDDADYEQAAVDFCDTFILPDQSITPRAVAWLNEGDAVNADGIHAVVDTILREKHLSLPDGIDPLPYDHASVLFFVAANLRQINDTQAGEFEKATLGSWIPAFGRALQKSSHCFYRAIGSIVASL
ncbi:MAG: molecular chaperone TorD family protein [Verrucomicrobiales bacterium]|nr:molecular chaperone TorD family protein [Verrucomicrobiales bacterium]